MCYHYKYANLLLSLRSLNFVSIHQCHSFKYFWLVEGNLPIWHQLSFNSIGQCKRKKINSFCLTDNSFGRNNSQKKPRKASLMKSDAYFAVEEK